MEEEKSCEFPRVNRQQNSQRLTLNQDQFPLQPTLEIYIQDLACVKTFAQSSELLAWAMAKERGWVGLYWLVLRSTKPFTPWAFSLTNLGRLPMLTLTLKAQFDLSRNKCSRETKNTMANSPAALLLRRGALFFKPAAFREEADLQRHQPSRLEEDASRNRDLYKELEDILRGQHAQTIHFTKKTTILPGTPLTLNSLNLLY